MLFTTIASSALILSIALVRRWFRGRLNLRLQYALWLLVAVRLLLPLPPVQSPVSILNVLEPAIPVLSTEGPTQPPELPVVGSTPSTTAEGTEYTGHGSPAGSTAPEKADPAPFTAESNKLENTLRAIWLAGAVTAGLWFVAQNLWFYTRLRKTRERVSVPDSRLPVYISRDVKSPCLFGLNPAIYLPPTCLEQSALRYVLAHEETHYKHGDHLWAYVRCLCLALHWHNPFVWWAAALSRQDCEMACDESTLNRIGDEHRKSYGNTLIGMIERRVRPSDLLSSATTMSAGMSGIKERITMIAQRPKMLLSTLIIVVACLVVAVSCTFTGPAKNADKDLTLYDRGGIIIAIPEKYKDQVLVDPVQSDDESRLISVYHRSIYERHRTGFLFGIVRYSLAQYEQFLCSDGSGMSFFAKADDWYYGFVIATDMQAPPDDHESFTALLTELGDYVKSDMVARNNLASYSDDEFFGRTYTYDSPHVFLDYYPYFAYGGSKEEVWTLTLSQPAKQGDGGIWCVERWTDAAGNVYPYFPDAGGISSAEYYAERQAQCDQGNDLFWLDPRGVALEFVKKVFGHSEASLDSFSIAGDSAASGNNLFDAREVSVGDSIVGLTIADIEIDEHDWTPVYGDDYYSATVRFKGEVTVTGRYYCAVSKEAVALPEEDRPAPEPVFFLDDESAARLPWIEGDGRAVSFHIANVSDALELLGPAGYEVRATIVIDDYVIRRHPSSEGIDFARLVGVVERLGIPRMYSPFSIHMPETGDSIRLGLYYSEFPFGCDLVENSRRSYRAESFGNVTVVECDGLQVTYLDFGDNTSSVITIRAAKEGYAAGDIPIGASEESLLSLWSDQLKQLESISYDDEVWFGTSYDYAYAYTHKEGTKSLVFIIKDGKVSGIEIVDGLDGPMY